MYFIEPKKVPERDPKESLLHFDVAEPSPMGLWRCGQLCSSAAGSDSFARSTEGGYQMDSATVHVHCVWNNSPSTPRFAPE